MANVKKTIWLFSAYRSDSHAYWADWLVNTFEEFQWEKLELPGRYFSWRIRGNPLSWLHQLPGGTPDLIIATSMVDLATLTGAIIVSLGSEYAGLFSNDDKLSKQIFDAGEKVDEKVWRLPLHKNYDKLMDSKTADMQNINYVGGAGSTTAAQFLQRFIINKTPWAHLDIAGMAFSKYGGALNPSGATGYGVRLLNKFVEDNYE